MFFSVARHISRITRCCAMPPFKAPQIHFSISILLLRPTDPEGRSSVKCATRVCTVPFSIAVASVARRARPRNTTRARSPRTQCPLSVTRTKLLQQKCLTSRSQLVIVSVVNMKFYNDGTCNVICNNAFTKDQITSIFISQKSNKLTL